MTPLTHYELDKIFTKARIKALSPGKPEGWCGDRNGDCHVWGWGWSRVITRDEAVAQLRREREKGANAVEVTPVDAHTWQCGNWTVEQIDGHLTCNCPDHAYNGQELCKHTIAVERQCAADLGLGTPVDPQRTPDITQESATVQAISPVFDTRYGRRQKVTIGGEEFWVDEGEYPDLTVGEPVFVVRYLRLGERRKRFFPESDYAA